jgi:polyhydroxybutyrate depolymerase
MRWALLSALLVVSAACGRGAPGATASREARAAASGPKRAAGSCAPAPRAPASGPPRPAPFVLGLAGGGPPRGLLLALHGYGDDGRRFATDLDLPALAARARFVLVAPDGTPDRHGRRFWNATDACCDFDGLAVDDVAYLTGLVREVAATWRVPRDRIYVLGLSNGAFMAHRLACEAADDFAAIVAVAGAPFADEARCRPRSPVSVLQVHGDADAIIAYAGGRDVLGRGGAAYPGAREAARRWARLDGCGGPLAPAGPALDLDAAVPGAETRVEAAPGCPPGVDVRLFTMHGAPHVPAFSAAFGARVWEWLAAHPKLRGR